MNKKQASIAHKMNINYHSTPNWIYLLNFNIIVTTYGVKLIQSIALQARAWFQFSVTPYRYDTYVRVSPLDTVDIVYYPSTHPPCIPTVYIHPQDYGNIVVGPPRPLTFVGAN